MSRREIEDYIIERTYVDPEFRRRLLEKPEELLTELGIPIGRNVKVRVIEEEPRTFSIVVPRAMTEGGELNEEDIQLLSGGTETHDMFRFFNPKKKK